MKFSAKKVTLALATLVFTATFAASSHALCGATPKHNFHPQSWHGSNSLPSLLPIADEPSIVGMWHVAFTAKGNGSDGPPDGAPIDNALVTWHSDGTELMNSDRPPQDGQFCMGVWERTGALKYKLNHFAWAGNDTENPGGVGNPAGPTHIVEEITLCPGGNQFEGNFTLDAYDAKGNVTHIVGVLKGVRITVNTTVKELL
jgi:hypothetical protein